MISRRATVVAAVVSGVVLMPTGAAQAQEMGRECAAPGGFDTITEPTGKISRELIALVDKNMDGTICAKGLGLPEVAGFTGILIDNLVGGASGR